MNREQIQHEEALQLLADYRMGEIRVPLYRSMIVQWGKAHLLEARPEIEPFLHSPDAEVRSSALDVLTGRFRLQEYWPTSVQFLLYDPEYVARVTGTTALGWLKANTKDKKTLGVLASVAQDRYDYEMVRENAYRAMRIVAYGDWEPLGHAPEHYFDLERDADWNFINTSTDSELEEEWRREAQTEFDLYRAGKVSEAGYYAMLLRFGRTKLLEAREIVEKFLSSPTPLLRITALRVLVLYLQVPGNWQIAVNILQYSSDPAQRQEAAAILGLLMRNTRDKVTLHILNQFTEDNDIWTDVFDAMGKIYPGSNEDLQAFLASPDDPPSQNLPEVPPT